NFPLLLLDVAPRTEIERAFIAALAKAAGPALAVCSPRDEKTVAFISQALNCVADRSSDPGSTALDRLRRHVFSASAPPHNELDTTLEFRSATDEARE